MRAKRTMAEWWRFKPVLENRGLWLGGLNENGDYCNSLFIIGGPGGGSVRRR